jgi:tyrosyl-tRNA synthetase
MSISDELMWKYYTYLTDLKASEIEEMQSEAAAGKLHPMQAKKDLAWGIVKDFHSTEAADAAAENWAKQFQQRAVSEDLPVVQVSLSGDGLLDGEGAVRLPKLLVTAGLAASTGDATRKLGENAVSVDGAKFAEKTLRGAKAGETVALRLGKRSVRVEWIQ